MEEWIPPIGRWVMCYDRIRDGPEDFVVVSPPYRDFGHTVVDAVNVHEPKLLVRVGGTPYSDRARTTAVALSEAADAVTTSTLSVEAVEPFPSEER